MLLSHFMPPDKAHITTRLGRRLAALEAARDGLLARRHLSGNGEIRRDTHEYWLASNRDLLHPLSGKWLHNQVTTAPRSPRDLAEEVELARQARLRLRGAGSLGANQLLKWICDVNRLTDISGGGELRTINVFSSADRLGRRIAFSAPNDLRRQLDLLSQAAHDWQDYPTFRALLLLLAVIAIHPFTDGNGRTARACFNALLTDEPAAPFVPVRMIMDCSCGGLEIRMRDAIFNQSWGEIISYFAAALDLS